MPGRRRRNRAPGGRPFEYLVSFSLEEVSALQLAATRDNMAVGAWIADAATRVACSETIPVSTPGETMQALMGVRSEVTEDRRLLRNIAGNLNDVARHANSTEEIPPQWPTRVLVEVEKATGRIEALVQRLDELTAIVRRRIIG